MNKNLFARFAPAIQSTDFQNVTDSSTIPPEFLLGKDGTLTSHYIPFDWVNQEAKVILIGITPGFTQWINAMREAQYQLRAGASLQDAHIAAKRTGAFSGAMRPNLVAMLDEIGVHKWLNIASCASLFDADAHLVQTTSILRHPIFVDGANYNGTPKMTTTPFLKDQLLTYFGQEATVKDALLIPLGPKVSEALDWLVQLNGLNAERILDGLPHPSGANAERIAYFLGRKDKSALSVKTNAAQLDASRQALLLKMKKLT